jgi:hypothetical protein
MCTSENSVKAKFAGLRFSVTRIVDEQLTPKKRGRLRKAR